MEEIWKIYKQTNKDNPHSKSRWGYRTYEVSNFGNVKINGTLVDFSSQNNIRYYGIGGFSVHRAVAELFIPNPENKPQVDHIDTNTHNNKSNNLRWVTAKENRNNPLSYQKLIGVKRTEEWRRKISEALKGKPNYTARLRKGISNPKISAALTGRKLSEEHKKHISESCKGTTRPPRSEEYKRKQSESHTGEKHPMFGRKRKHISKDGVKKFIFIEELDYYIKNNWKLGW